MYRSAPDSGRRRLPRYDGCSGECGGQIARDQGVVVGVAGRDWSRGPRAPRDRKSTRLNSSHTVISYAVFCLKKKKTKKHKNKHNIIPIQRTDITAYKDRNGT